MCYMMIFFIFCYPLKIFMVFTTIVTFFMFFFFRRISISFESVLTLFFLLQKDFDTFYKRLFKAFLCFLIMSRGHFLYLWKNYLIGFYRSINRLKLLEITSTILISSHFDLHYIHCAKSVQIRSSFLSIFFCIWTE